MLNFNYTAHDASGKLTKGEISADSKTAALEALHARKMQPITIKQGKNVSLDMNLKLPGSSGVKSKDLVVFTRQCSTMVSAGVPILRTLTSLKEQSESPALREILEKIVADIQGGSTLSDALAKHPKVFSDIYVNMVRAGEAAGILDKVLDRLAFQQEKDAVIKSKIRSAMVYPGVIGGVTIVAFFILMTVIVPKIGTIITDLSGSAANLPVYTRAMLAASDFMKSPLFLLGFLVGLPVAFFLFRRWTKTPKGRYRWHSFLLKIPVVKVIIIKTAIARFSRIFASLMGAGVSIVQSINTTAGAIGNAVIEKELRDCSKAIQAGGELSTELQKSQHFPAIVSQMLAVGEETGQTDTVILKVAEFYEQEVDTAIGSISSIIEPVMIVVLGGMVGLVAVSVFGPITQISTSAG